MDLDDEELEATKKLNRQEKMSERIEIDFSKKGEGKILMTQVGNSLYLDRALVDNLKIGDIVQMGDPNFEKLVKLNFYQVETVDIMIEKLIAIKNNLILHIAS